MIRLIILSILLISPFIQVLIIVFFLKPHAELGFVYSWYYISDSYSMDKRIQITIVFRKVYTGDPFFIIANPLIY